MNSKAILEGLRVKKHKRPRASLERTTSEASLETTPELMRSASESSRQDSPPVESPRLRLLNREFREIPLSPIVETGNRHESRPVAGQDDNREMSYPEAAEVAMAGLHGMANFMNAGLAKYQELAAEHEATKAKLSAAEAKAKTAESKAKSAAKREAKALSVAEEAKKKIAELEAGVEEMKAELAVNREKIASVTTGQGGMLRAFAEKIFRSTHFGGLVAQLLGALGTSVTNAVIDLIAQDYPDLDKDKYGYEAISEEEMMRDYAEVLLEHTAKVPVVESLAQQRVLLSESVVRKCPADKDEKLEAIIAELAGTSGGRSAEGHAGEDHMAEDDQNKVD